MKTKYLLRGAAMAAMLAVSTVSHAVPTEVVFNSNDYQLIALVNQDLVNAEFSFINNTAEVWTDFHFYSGPDDGTWNSQYGLVNGDATTGIAGYIETTSGGYDGVTYDGPGTYTLNNTITSAVGFQVDVVGLSVAVGAALDFTIDYDVLEGNGGLWWLSALPTTGGITPQCQFGGVYPNCNPDPGNGSCDGPDQPLCIPEPASLALMGLGLVGLGFARRKKVI